MKRLVFLLIISVFLLGCAPMEPPVIQPVQKPLQEPVSYFYDPEISRALAILQPTQNNEAMGIVTFINTEHGIRVLAGFTGLTDGTHGFHIHEIGDCSAPDGKSAGGHFNPMGLAHGNPDAGERHVGDLGNIEVNGKATVDATYTHISFTDVNSIIGRAVIIHAEADDFGQPTGNAGSRVACGVIEIANSPKDLK